MQNDSKMVFARIWPGCNWCPNDDAVVLNDAPILKDSQIAFMHEAFEKFFCTKLQNSGLANFADVHDCSFHFVNSPAGGADAAQQEGGCWVERIESPGPSFWLSLVDSYVAFCCGDRDTFGLVGYIWCWSAGIAAAHA
jgi:hypothetical protein